MQKVMAFGTFDLIHRGHLAYLEEAKSYGDYLVVVVALDTTVCAVKGALPRHNQEERLCAVAGLDIVDKAILGNAEDKYSVIHSEQPDHIVLGYDQSAFVDRLQGALDAMGVACEVHRASAFAPEKYKSSKLKEKYSEIIATYE